MLARKTKGQPSIVHTAIIRHTFSTIMSIINVSKLCILPSLQLLHSERIPLIVYTIYICFFLWLTCSISLCHVCDNNTFLLTLSRRWPINNKWHLPFMFSCFLPCNLDLPSNLCRLRLSWDLKRNLVLVWRKKVLKASLLYKKLQIWLRSLLGTRVLKLI